jgi:hypothetical protein
LNDIIDLFKRENPNFIIRVCFVGYRDIKDPNRFSVHEFSEDLNKIKSFIQTVKAEGGADFPEDV